MCILLAVLAARQDVRIEQASIVQRADCCRVKKRNGAEGMGATTQEMIIKSVTFYLFVTAGGWNNKSEMGCFVALWLFGGDEINLWNILRFGCLKLTCMTTKRTSANCNRPSRKINSIFFSSIVLVQLITMSVDHCIVRYALQKLSG